MRSTRVSARRATRRVPKVRAIEGNVGAIGLADRDTGRVSMITLWDSADSVRASEQEADQLRERTADLGGQRSPVARYEVAIAQLATGGRT
jgi:heme-degrading monooxygenase HmoA